MSDELKTGKGWFELSRKVTVYQAGPVKLKDLQKMLEELMEPSHDKPIT